MTVLKFEGNNYYPTHGESVLECLLRNEVHITNSCRSGVCHSCVLKTNGPVSADSQKGLSPAKRERGYFLSCQEKVKNNLEVFRLETNKSLTEGVVISQDRVSESVVIVKIKPLSKFSYRAGQFLNLIRQDGFCRSYSIASQTKKSELEFHIRRITDGVMSRWFYDENHEGAKILLSEANGDCYLTEEMQDKNLLLIGVGTGLAPLYGILQDRIATSSICETTLVHGGFTEKSLYFVEKIKAIEANNSLVKYKPVFLSGEEREGFTKSDLVEFIKNLDYDKSRTIVMVCGDPTLVKKIKQTIFISGVSSKNIFSDPFVSSGACTT